MWEGGRICSGSDAAATALKGWKCCMMPPHVARSEAEGLRHSRPGVRPAHNHARGMEAVRRWRRKAPSRSVHTYHCPSLAFLPPINRRHCMTQLTPATDSTDLPPPFLLPSLLFPTTPRFQCEQQRDPHRLWLWWHPGQKPEHTPADCQGHRVRGGPHCFVICVRWRHL